MKTSSGESDAPRPSLAAVARLYFRIGNSTFGSGNTTMLLLGREMTERRWLRQWEFDLLYTLARVVPGTNVLAFVASSAHAVRGWAGALAAIVALCIPASCVIVLLTLGYQRWHDHPVGSPAINAAMSAIVGVIAGASWLIVGPRLRPGERVRTVVLAGAAVVLSLWVSPLTILALGAVAGYFWPERRA